MDRAAARMPAGFRVDAVSGQRLPGNTHNHDHGYAIDTKMYDPQGNYLGNYQDPSSFRAYEAYAQETHRQLQQMLNDPSLSEAERATVREALNNHTYGGYFSEASSYPRDQMHQHTTPRSVSPQGAGGTWEAGVIGNKAYKGVSKPISTAHWGIDGKDGQTLSNADLGRPTPGWSMSSPTPASQYEGVDGFDGRGLKFSDAKTFNGRNVTPEMKSALLGAAYSPATSQPLDQPGFQPGPLGPYSMVSKFNVNGIPGNATSMPFDTPRPPGAIAAPVGPLAHPISRPTPALGMARPGVVTSAPLAPVARPAAPAYNALMGAVDHAPGPAASWAAARAWGAQNANPAPRAPSYNPLMGAVDSAPGAQPGGLGGLLGTLARAAAANPTRSTAAPMGAALGNFGGYQAPPQAPGSPTRVTSAQSPSDPKSFNASWASARDFGMANAAQPAPRAPAYNALMSAVDRAPQAPAYRTESVANPAYGPALAAYNSALAGIAGSAPITGPAPGTPGVGKPGETAVGGIAGVGPQTYAPAAPPQLPSLPPQFIEKRVPVAPVMPARVRTPTPLAAYGAPPQNPANFQAALGSALAGTSATSALGQALKSYGVGAAPAGTSWGMTSFGGAPTPIQNSAPDYVKIAATGPSIFGAKAPTLPSWLGGNYLNSAGPTQGGHVTNLGGVMSGYADSNKQFADVGNMLLGLMAGRGGGGASGFGGGARSSSEGGNLHG